MALSLPVKCSPEIVEALTDDYQLSRLNQPSLHMHVYPENLATAQILENYPR